MVFVGNLTEEEKEYMRIIEECTKFELVDELELDDYETEMEQLLESVNEEVDGFEKTNSRVFVKSLYNH